MKKSYIKCPYCQDEVSCSGSSMHVRNKHSDKVEEFKKNYPELKKQATVKEAGSKVQASTTQPPRIEDKTGDAGDKDKDRGDKHRDTTEDKQGKPEDKSKAGDDKSAQGKSFLRELDDWLDSPEF